MHLLTPPGIAGVAVVRADLGERAALLAALSAPGGGALSIRPGEAPRRAVLRVGGHAVDDVLVVDRGPRGLELHLHGAPAVLAELDRAFGVRSALPASPAERLRCSAASVEQFELAAEQLGHDFDACLAAAAWSI
jgi:hypothetical protein